MRDLMGANRLFNSVLDAQRGLGLILRLPDAQSQLSTFYLSEIPTPAATTGCVAKE